MTRDASPAPPPSTKEVLLASYRVGKLHHVESSGRCVFLDHEGHLCCQHGERGRAISRWLSKEKEIAIALSEGRVVESFKRDSVCDCKTTDGLYATPQIKPPVPPWSIYAFLQDQDAPFVFSRHVPAVELPFHPGTYLRTDGKLACRHGYTQRSIKRGRCACIVPNLPKRNGIEMGLHPPRKRVCVVEGAK